jgi:hypothetical protein
MIMREVLKYLSGGVLVYLVMAACSASNSTGRGRRASNDMDASTGGVTANVNPNGGTPGAGNGGTGQGNAGSMQGNGGSMMDPVPNANAQTTNETITHSGVVDVACAQLGTTSATITQTNPSDNSVVYSVTTSYTYYEASITDTNVTLGAIRYAFVQMQGPPVVGNTDTCAAYAGQPNVTCTVEGSIPPTAAGTFVPSIGEGKISVSCGYLSQTTTTTAGQAPETTTSDTRWQSAKFSYGTAS